VSAAHSSLPYSPSEIRHKKEMRKSLIKQVPPSHPLEKRDSQELGSSQPERVPCFLKMQVSLSLFCSSKLSASDSKEMRRIIFFDLFIYFRSYTTSP
jgi:hypothetical protein